MFSFLKNSANSNKYPNLSNILAPIIGHIVQFKECYLEKDKVQFQMKVEQLFKGFHSIEVGII